MVKYSAENNSTVDSRLDAAFAALSDRTRRAILARLAEGEATAGELAEPFTMSLPAISKHLKVLENAGFLDRNREGRFHRCSLDASPLKFAAEWISTYKQFWESQFDQLARYLEEQSEPTRPENNENEENQDEPSRDSRN